ncbi:cathepsin L-like [Bacillus rossius redtenbacheri]|uniref:cathepsin L-like n=1 Tax=Bacillus rossius redtenbacheri TaxID=93214 RepID=UPI002FDE6AE7
MKIFILILSCLAIACEAVSFMDLIMEEWNTFKLEHQKEYENAVEEKFRMKIFMENRKKIAKHNSHFEKGEVKYKLGMNKYSDLLPHEFVATLNGFNRTARTSPSGAVGLGAVRPRGAKFVSPANVKLADSVDWREQGAVTPVKDQGHCGSCWSFSTTGSLEGQHFRQEGYLVSLSEQNLIDCSTKYGNEGCNGGMMDFAFQYIRDNRGIDTERYYPYKAHDDKCHFNPRAIGAEDVGYVDIPTGDEDKLKEAVATVGPISIAIDASRDTFQLYRTGVYYDPECSSEELDHGVLVVGYGTDEEGQDYWIVKNSWGPTWGDQGYIYMARNRNNSCGVATSASYPLV